MNATIEKKNNQLKDHDKFALWNYLRTNKDELLTLTNSQLATRGSTALGIIITENNIMKARELLEWPSNKKSSSTQVHKNIKTLQCEVELMARILIESHFITSKENVRQLSLIAGIEQS